ncbi:hypothetical protein H5410_017805 [Solanum commersonii]|uniref:C3H1-type domain-containing protein n=1 Tax=Solanum commersonii TaxID=4109 RepID=A0A9J6A075_SOLCO|nr:hypothetical protein H5410_017805 [Solanum commersonii]
MEAIEQHQNQNQNHNQSSDQTEELGIESQNSETLLLPSDLNFQNPNQNQPKADESDDDDEMTMQAICEELKNLVLSQVMDEDGGNQDLHHLDREESGKLKEKLEDELVNVEGNDDGWGYVGEYGYDQYDEDGDENRSGSRNGNEIDGENENGYEGDSKEAGFNANRINKRKINYPLRPDAQDCPYYMKTGMCKFGSNCKFNHPSRRRIQGTKEKGKQREDSQERPGQIECKNQCFMMKWLWRFASSEQAPLWKDVIQAKYEMVDHWITKMVTGIYGSRLWRAIRNHWRKLRGNCNIKLGNGRKTSFGEDRWLEQGSLKTLFPHIFRLNQQQRAIVAKIWASQGWNLSFRRYLNDWEIHRLVEFYKVVGQFIGTTDAQVWGGRIIIKTISVSKEPTRSLILVTVRGMGGHGS